MEGAETQFPVEKKGKEKEKGGKKKKEKGKEKGSVLTSSFLLFFYC